ncbi:MAG: response regulator transcription factor [Pseudomonadota bacterium]
MNIAFVEDDPIQRTPVHTWLKEAGHSCHCYDDCESYLSKSADGANYELLLLDWELPDHSGLELLRWVRREHGDTLPVVFLTRRDHEQDIVAALRSGADDYVIKPARRDELLARIEAVSRRVGMNPDTSHYQTIGPFELDRPTRHLLYNGRTVNLTQKEFCLAYYLLTNLGQLVTRQELLERVWRQSPNLNTRTVDTHISRLRRKLELFPENGWHLTAVYQYGYRLDWLEEEEV